MEAEEFVSAALPFSVFMSEKGSARRTPQEDLNVLFVEDRYPDVELCLRELRKGGFEPRFDVVVTPQEFVHALETRPYDIILADYKLPNWTGIEALRLLKEKELDIPIILVSGTLGEESAVDFIKKGLADYVLKDSLPRVPLAVRRALEEKRQRERLNLEAAKLRELEERYRHWVELSPDALFVQSGGRFAFINKAGARLLGGRDASDFLGKPILDIVHPDYHELVQARINRLLHGEEVPPQDQKLVRLDGGVVDVEVAAVPTTFDGKPAAQVIVRDITERKRIEEAFRKLAAFAQLNPNPVLELDALGRVAYYNEAAQSMAAQHGKGHPKDTLPPEAVSIVQECLTTGRKRLGMEISMGGRTISWSFFPAPADALVLCHAVDITDRLNLENQLRHSQKLESVGQLAAGVAHDFNNMLTVIQGHASLLQSEPDVGEKVRESLNHVRHAAERASNLTRQLLAFSRKQILQPCPIDLNEIISSVTRMLQRTLGEDIALQLNYARELPLVEADAGMMEQVITNLAVNARDAMPKGGRLTIGVSWTDVNELYKHPEARPGKFICLQVKDTGQGMDAATLERIFEPFFTTKDPGKGTGLGLATVYGIVKQHGGWIEARSQPGKGTTFQVFLPPCPGAEQRQPPGLSRQSVSGGTETILVVEDEPAVRAMLKSILAAYGYQVLEARTGSEALDVWRRFPAVDLVIADLVMPDAMNGPEMAARLQAEKPDLKILYTSGYSLDVAGPGLVLEEGVNFLEKPYDKNRLAQVVRQILDQAAPTRS